MDLGPLLTDIFHALVARATYYTINALARVNRRSAQVAQNRLNDLKASSRYIEASKHGGDGICTIIRYPYMLISKNITAYGYTIRVQYRAGAWYSWCTATSGHIGLASAPHITITRGATLIIAYFTSGYHILDLVNRTISSYRGRDSIYVICGHNAATDQVRITGQLLSSVPYAPVGLDIRPNAPVGPRPTDPLELIRWSVNIFANAADTHEFGGAGCALRQGGIMSPAHYWEYLG